MIDKTSLAFIVPTVICCCASVFAAEPSLSPKAKELFERISTPSIPEEIIIEKFTKNDYYGSSTKEEVAQYVFDLDSKNTSFFVFADPEPGEQKYSLRFLALLATPKSLPFLRCVLLRNILSPDAQVRKVCLMGLSKIDAATAKAAALILLSRDEKEVLLFVVHILLENPDEAVWRVLKRLYAKTKGNESLGAANVALESGGIEKSWAEKSSQIQK